jgi:hypothetical protein
MYGVVLAGLNVDDGKQHLMHHAPMLALASIETMGVDSMHSDAIIMQKFM